MLLLRRRAAKEGDYEEPGNWYPAKQPGRADVIQIDATVSLEAYGVGRAGTLISDGCSLGPCEEGDEVPSATEGDNGPAGSCGTALEGDEVGCELGGRFGASCQLLH